MGVGLVLIFVGLALVLRTLRGDLAGALLGEQVSAAADDVQPPAGPSGPLPAVPGELPEGHDRYLEDEGCDSGFRDSVTNQCVPLGEH